ncbi:molybdenum cofactor guanylyltransferase [Bacillus carboniphilus]|uniref:Probable molybdenum cofactor guanylyltransferase n=1 Tax=Bacillus carboniphilus TaxID=86663 RepID=A0ABY9JSK5_9BACI|nr:molybdenum cofactor guanylyltransferase [Bacillus carboniphilus]WLR42381.1 molybdenum cofactor guanylyltransferase [Bacillus carboniphilus]
MDNQDNEIVGIILAGGHSVRFGQNKAQALYNGFPFYHYSIHALTTQLSKSFIVTNNQYYSFYKKNTSLYVIKDMERWKDHGPLGGLYSALQEIDSDWYFVLPIDIPFVTRRLIERLSSYVSNQYDAVVPVVKNKKQPLIALYRSTVKTTLKEQLINRNLKMGIFLKNINVYYVDENELGCSLEFTNINTKKDYYYHIANQKE